MSQASSSLPSSLAAELLVAPVSKAFWLAARTFQRRVRETLSNHSVSVRTTVGKGYWEAVMVTWSPWRSSTRPLPSKAQ